MRNAAVRPVASVLRADEAGPSADDGRWRLAWLLVAPHRLGFFAGALMLALSATWWAGVQISRAYGGAWPWAVSPSSAHSLLMSLGFTPLFMVGFLFTAGPRWLGLGEVAARNLCRPVVAMLIGWAIAIGGLHVHHAAAGAGVALVAAGWAHLSWRFVAMLRASRLADRTHAKLIALSCLVGVLALCGAALALFAQHETGLRCAAQLALWGFVAPVFAVVSHRMIPFFSASALPLLDAWRPMWLLAVMVAVLWWQALLSIAELWWWPLPDTLRWLQVAVEAPAAALLLWLALRWGLLQSLRIRLLAMLHAGFVWFGVALALAATSHALMASTGGQLSLGLAPLHAMTMGYLGATLIAMATRVASGHSGRPLAADNPAWALYWVLQLAALLRVLAALLLAASMPQGVTTLIVAAASLWALGCSAWALRYGSWFGRPRVDGRPG